MRQEQFDQLVEHKKKVSVSSTFELYKTPGQGDEADFKPFEIKRNNLVEENKKIELGETL